MRFLHTSDWHLGRQFHNLSLLEDQRHALDQIKQRTRQLEELATAHQQAQEQQRKVQRALSLLF